MNHDQALAALDALLDGELSAAETRDLEAHLSGCADCARARERRLAVREKLQRAFAETAAPDELHRRISAEIRGADVRPMRWRVGSGLRLLAAAASLVVVAGGGWWMAERGSAERELESELLASHVRSLMPGHLTDVLSTDQHTVKPWFNGKVDFSPPVRDFAAQGFPLVGGRLDYVDGRTVAALVYARRQHYINVFLWPTTPAQPASPAQPATRQGYHLLRGSCGDYTCWVVSDVGEDELRQFAGMLAPTGGSGE